MFGRSSSGSFNGTRSYLRALTRLDLPGILNASGPAGVAALAKATPVESGRASQSWEYEVVGDNQFCTISWFNTDVESGFPVAVALQFGYATGTGGYVAGRDYINPAMRPIFDQIEARVLKAVNSAR